MIKRFNDSMNKWFIPSPFPSVSPDRRQHRGAHPADQVMFTPERMPTLRTATAELSWLLSRAYAVRAALKLVGDRHGLTERQRLAVARAACSDTSLTRRQ